MTLRQEVKRKCGGPVRTGMNGKPLSTTGAQEVGALTALGDVDPPLV